MKEQQRSEEISEAKRAMERKITLKRKKHKQGSRSKT